jgi:hypothetical protein
VCGAVECNICSIPLANNILVQEMRIESGTAYVCTLENLVDDDRRMAFLVNQRDDRSRSRR